MRLEFSFFRSTLGRRILLLFVVCALVPVSLLAYFSLRQVSDGLETEARQRLAQVTRNAGVSVLEGLSLVCAELEVIGTFESASIVRQSQPRRTGDRVLGFERLSGVMLTGEGMQTRLVSGASFPLPESGRLREGKGSGPGMPLLITESRPGVASRVLVALPLGRGGERGRFLLGEVNPQYLWDLVSNALLPGMEICILDGEGHPIYGAATLSDGALSKVRDAVRRSFMGHFEWQEGPRTYLFSYRALFFKGNFDAGDWVLVASQPKANALASLSRFTRTFVLIFLLTLGTVLFFSSVQIRRNLVPLTRLKEGTTRIAEGNFESRVQVRSGDEFEELAAAFNTMTDHLGREFRALDETGRIVRLLLTALDRRKVVDVALGSLSSVIPVSMTAITLRGPDGSSETVLAVTPDQGTVRERYPSVLSCDEVRILESSAESLEAGEGRRFEPILGPLRRQGARLCHLFPLLVEERLAGILTLGYVHPTECKREDLIRVRQIADQVAVALFNANLIEELAGLSWGTMTALARAVDAKSPWTAGHSERVTAIALEIGRDMGLSSRELETLQRGGLLHDLGKIGVPGTVLDKPGKLTDEEYALIKTHPAKGGRILEPIPAFAGVIPLVVHHHERFDGAGYPDGLSGTGISLGARILAVADVYDALISDRPYRPGWPVQKVIDYIEGESGLQFDPGVVKAFIRVVQAAAEPDAPSARRKLQEPTPAIAGL